MSLPQMVEMRGRTFTHSGPGSAGSGTSRSFTGASGVNRTFGHLPTSAPVSRYCGMLYSKVMAFISTPFRCDSWSAGVAGKRLQMMPLKICLVQYDDTTYDGPLTDLFNRGSWESVIIFVSLGRYPDVD